MQTLYVDVLFFINFFMDGLSLLLTGGLLHLERRPLRVALAAMIGAAYAVADVLFPGNAVISAATGVVLSVVLVRIAFPMPSFRRFLGATLAFFAVSVFLGGAVTVLYSLLQKLFGNSVAPSATRSDVILTLSGISGALIALGMRFFRYRLGGTRREILLTPGRAAGENGTAAISFSALVDSGNLLSDPLSGKPVILLGRAAGERLFPRGAPTPERETATHGFHPVFIETAAGRKMLWAFSPEVILLLEKRGGARLSAVVALDEYSEKYGDCDALLPTSLLL